MCTCPNNAQARRSETGEKMFTDEGIVNVASIAIYAVPIWAEAMNKMTFRIGI